MIPQERRLLFIGPSGTGKTSIIQEYMKQHLTKDRYITHTLTFSALTSASQILDSLFSKLERRKKGFFPVYEIIFYLIELYLSFSNKNAYLHHEYVYQLWTVFTHFKLLLFQVFKNVSHLPKISQSTHNKENLTQQANTHRRAGSTCCC